MGETVIKVEGLAKEYLIGARESGRETFREMLTSSFVAPFRRFRRLSGEAAPEERIWALKDVSFEVGEGEVVGIIGRNGAGKSTLLKILSRITEPTEGRALIRGRVASLLEVGTGFHPELTGRENIHLNGAILGMSRAEIARKFDEIVEFAEIEKFLDTPVKRYSSGMAVRLAFAVAAHLDPEILLVDEVLAVGDAAFQKKCLGKIHEVSGEGRTVVFVSHNMQAVQSLCTWALLLERGVVSFAGSTESVVTSYLDRTFKSTTTTWSDPTGLGDDMVRLKGLRAFSAGQVVSGNAFPSRNDILVEMVVELKRQTVGLCVGFDLIGRDGSTVMRSYDTDVSSSCLSPLEIGSNHLRCKIPAGLLNGGMYYVSPRIGIHNQRWIVASDNMIQFYVILNHGQSYFWTDLSERNRPGIVAPILNWTKVR